MRPYNRSVPLYEYECRDCHFRFEKLQRLSDPPPPKCPECGGKIAQLLSAPAVQFKGSGWYVTDYGRKSSGGEKSGDQGSSSAGAADTKSDSKSDTKSETKAETKRAGKDAKEKK